MKVHLGTPVATDVIDAESPDAVIVATGATFDRTGSTAFVSDPIPGFDRDFVHTPEAVLGGDFAVDGTGDRPRRGDDVTGPRRRRSARTTRPRVSSSSPGSSRVGLALAGGWQHSHVMRRLHELGITTATEYVRARHRRSHRHPVRREHGRGVDRPDVAGVVLVTGRSSRNELAPPSLPASTTCA